MAPILAFLLLASCEAPAPPSHAPGPSEPAPSATKKPAPVATIMLARHPELIVELDLPKSSRAGTATELFRPDGWTFVESRGPIDVYAAPPPVLVTLRPGKPIEGFTLENRLGAPLPASAAPDPFTWESGDGQMLLKVPAGAPPPPADAFLVRHRRSAAKLAAWNLDSSGLAARDFLFRSARLNRSHRAGILLPAPGRVGWRVVVPQNGKLLLDTALLLPPLLAERVSDGVSLVAEVETAEGVREVGKVEVKPGDWEDIEADLAAFAGQEVTLRLHSEPGATALSDYLFVGEPTLYTPKTDPRRLVIVMADTLRADRLGFYGYTERPTSPGIDRWAEGAVVFDSARAAAPWTYPSMRAALSGRFPDRWDDGPHLQDRLAEAGWVTAAFVDNAYLTDNFGMAEGWGWHFANQDFDARRQAGNLAQVLEKNTDRDVAVFLQYMETHLPYAEPDSWRKRWVTSEVDGLADPIRQQDVEALVRKSPGRKHEIATYLSARYDQSVAHLDTQVAGLLTGRGPRDIVVFMSDHGEEFWEHDGFAHGHALYDETIRVALAIEAPGLDPRRVAEPVSLIDLTPTLLDLAGVSFDPAQMDGVSLVPAMRGEDPARQALRERPLGMGWILWGSDAWGVVTEGQKWILRDSKGHVADLAGDPHERTWTTTDVDENGRFERDLARALDRPVDPVLRIVSPDERAKRPVSLRIRAPGGIEAVWAGLESPNLVPPVVEVEEGVAYVRGGQGGFFPLEVFVEPRRAGDELEVTVFGRSGEHTETVRVTGSGEYTLFRVQPDLGVELFSNAAPRPTERLQATDDEVADQLRALGYVE